MATPAFDTHKAVKALCSAGFDDAQAEAVVEQIGGAVQGNVATKTDIQGLVTSEELKDAIAPLATREELRREVANLPTREELGWEIEKLDTKLDNAIEKLDTKIDDAVEMLDTKIDDAVEKFQLRLEGEIGKQATKSLRSIVVVAAAFVGLSKALDLLVG